VARTYLPWPARARRAEARTDAALES
jgi:hypothetical protein